MIPIAEIQAARERLAGRIHRTPLLSAASLGAMAGVELFLKCESMQKTGSFKPRGALNKVRTLSAAAREKGLVTVSAGNHAQAVAWVARQMAIPCTVVMPAAAPRSKLDAVRGYGATVVLHEDRATLFEKLEEVRARLGATFIHPFDDPAGLAGAGTVGLEILEDLPDVDAVLVPVGGGGLLGGVASAIKAQRPACRVVAVELESGPGLAPALAAGKPIHVDRPADTLADGLTPPFVGTLALQIAREAVDEIVTVAETSIASAMVLLMTRAKIWVEGSGAAAAAAVVSSRARFPAGSRVVAIVSGGNADPRRVAALLD